MRTERANAKINLYLDVTGRRENGYHNIYSIMQTVSLCDLVSIDFHAGEHTSIHLEASGNDAMPTDCRNLAWRAAEKFLQAAGIRGVVHIIIQKRIPMAAGLAGGSADAAAVLRGLNAISGTPMTEEALCALGATLGADIPFCIRGGAALVSGIGECMEDFPVMPDGHLVVACRGEGVSTPWAYGELDRKYNNFQAPKNADDRVTVIKNAWEKGDLLASSKHFFNLFEEVVTKTHPDVTLIKSTMEAHGAVRAMMSGSGPSVFGVFESAEDADAACRALLATGAEAFVCHPMGK